MNVWLNMAESRMKTQGEIGPGYDDVKKQLEDHQVRSKPFLTSHEIAQCYFCLRCIARDIIWIISLRISFAYLNTLYRS